MLVVKEGGDCWRMVGFYGYPKSTHRRESCELTRKLVEDGSFPLCIIGDFNNIVTTKVKRGDPDCLGWFIRDFCEALMESDFPNMPIEGYPFTWWCGQRGVRAMKEQLDRAVISRSMRKLFSSCYLRNLLVVS